MNACPVSPVCWASNACTSASREVPDAQRFGPDVERAAAGDDRVLRARTDAVVAHVTHSAQHHALREAPGTLVIAGPQLPEYGDQRVPDQGIDLVDQQHQGSRVGHAPAGQRSPECAFGAESREDIGPEPVQRLVPRQERPVAQLAENGVHGASHVFARGLGGLDVHVHATEVALGAAVQQIPQREQGGGLARLPGRVQHEVPLVPDEFQDFGEIHPLQRRDAVMIRCDDGTFGIELAHGSKYGIAAVE